jgi:hypothetical protein
MNKGLSHQFTTALSMPLKNQFTTALSMPLKRRDLYLGLHRIQGETGIYVRQIEK